MLDAPVSGGQEKARSGTLTIMLGGKEEIFNQCKPILEQMGNPVLVGTIDAGETTKLVNQAIVAVNYASDCPGHGDDAGIDGRRTY